MSTSVTAHAIIGSLLWQSEVFVATREKAYEHSYGPEISFDPMTGQRLWRIISELKPGFTGDPFDENVKLGDYELIRGNRKPVSEEQDWYLSLMRSEDRQGLAPGLCPLFDKDDEAYISELVSGVLGTTLLRFQDTLSEVGLWYPERFGMWALKVFC